MALPNIIGHIWQEIDNTNFSIGIFLELAKAFDMIDDSMLLKKLEMYGIGGNALHCISNYLSQRSQCANDGGVLFKPEKIICGVPQNSVLGPILFILYINDIVNVSTILKLIILRMTLMFSLLIKMLINLFQS